MTHIYFFEFLLFLSAFLDYFEINTNGIRTVAILFILENNTILDFVENRQLIFML